MEKSSKNRYYNRKMAKKRLNENRQQTLKAIKGDLDLKPSQIISAFKNSNNANYSKVHEALNRLENKISNLPQGYVNQYALNKAGVKNLASLKRELAQQGVDYSGLSDKQLLDLIALDDWGTLFKVALPFLQEYGGKALKHLYNQYVKPKVERYLGGDSGINPLDWGVNGEYGQTLSSQKYTNAPGLMVEAPGIKPVESYHASFSTVDPKSIASSLCPELYKHRFAFIQTQRVALATVVKEYSITTNASGSFGFLCQPASPTGAAVSLSYAHGILYNDSTFSVTTGTQTANATLYAGPLNNSLASIASFRLTNASVIVNPIASFSTAGAFTLAYDNRSSNDVTLTSAGVTLSDLKMYPYVTSFNNKTVARMIYLTGDSADDEFISSGTNRHKFYLFGSGLPSSTEVCRILVTHVIEFKPTASALPLCPLDFPRVGPLTEQFESMILMRFPMLQTMDLSEAKRVTDTFPEDPTPFNTFFEIVANSIAGIQPRTSVLHLPTNDIALPNQSLELVFE